MKLRSTAQSAAQYLVGVLVLASLSACIIAPPRHVVVQPGPVVVGPAPVVVAPAVVAPPVVVVRPAVRYGYGWRGRPYQHHR